MAHASHLNQYYELFRGGHVHDAIAAYGARGDGTGDDAPAIQAAIDAAVKAGGGTVVLQTGTYALGSTLKLLETSNVRIQGLGATGQMDSTVLRWNGPPGGTALFIDRVRDSVLEGFSIVNGARPFGVGIDADQTAADPITSNLTFRELGIEGG
ncbi:MAG TPA: glycosyl hydrolase family 28-related protein, partial [Candidatus Eisenbacteria bacterium]|nr:glycosyl hydrolase family 28-related protein [Candidatus Eisenbacteria bacterium]